MSVQEKNGMLAVLERETQLHEAELRFDGRRRKV